MSVGPFNRPWPYGFPDLRLNPGLEKILLVLFYEFTYVPSNLPADQAVVIQLLSIG